MPSYNERLTANNQKIDDITTLANELPDADEINEKIDEQDTIIENLKSKLDEKAGKGGGEPNIFVQLEEPTTKKGIWLQKEAEPEHYTYDDEVFIGGEWMADGTHSDTPVASNGATFAHIGNYIYLFGMGGLNNQRTKAYKYNILTNTYTQMTNCPDSFDYCRCTVVNNDIYIYDSLYMYKYNIMNDTYTKMSDSPYYANDCGFNSVGTDIYMFGSTSDSYFPYGNYACKYDTLTDTYTRLNNMPYKFGANGCATAVIGTDIYLFSSNSDKKYNYKYDTLTDTYTQLTNIPYNFVNGVAASIGTNIYLFGGTEGNTNTYKYDTLTDTYTQLANIPIGYTSPNSSSALSVGTHIYLLGNNNNPTKIQCYTVESKTYEQDNLVVISQGKYNNVGYEIELYNSSKDVASPKYAFADAWYYTLAGGLETDIPTYYGDGTQWINIKNPINNGGGE